MMHRWDGEGWGVGHWLLMGFGMLLFWVLVVAAIVWLVRYLTVDRAAHHGPAGPVGPVGPVGPPRSTAQEILDERYARGEISDEEYRTRRDTLAAR